MARRIATIVLGVLVLGAVAGVFYLTVFILLEAIVPCVVVTGHVIVGVVTGDRHQRSAIYLTAGDAIVGHALVNVSFEVLLHINSSYIVVRAVSLQGCFQLGVANIGFVGIVGVGVTVTHEQQSALLCIRTEVVVECLSQLIHV